MELCLKITAGFLLLVQALHMVRSVTEPDPTDSPGRTIHQSWLRQPLKPGFGHQNLAAERPTEEPQEMDVAGMESSDDNISGMPYVSMAAASGDDGEMVNRDANATSDGVTIVNATMISMFLNETTVQPESAVTGVSQTSPATSPTNSSHVNVTKLEEDIQNVTTTTTAPQTTSTPQSNSTTPASTPETLTDAWPTNNTETTTNVTTAEAPELNEASSTPFSTTEFPSETTEMIPVTTTTAAAPSTAEKANLTDKGAASGSNSERGFASDVKKNKKKEAWEAILGTAVAVACVGLLVYIILKKKHQRDFSHRKLVEEFASDPVLRLDNSEPLDLNYGGSAYSNPGLQMDNIQMTNFPGRNNN
ncbi:mucin-15 [Myripristis murdjan]|uniref:mucin-15 n=1 Tax=Myripristis murdjan TaxID=586833 RepID=UPI001175D994|nr:mucin-15-like [Myripristis murdjan]